MDTGRVRRIKHEIVELCAAGLDSSQLSLEAERLLRTVVPFDRCCFHDVDPATVMLTSVMGECPPDDPRLPFMEYGEGDVNSYAELARRRPSVGILSQVTRGHPETSRRYREIWSDHGIEGELRASFVERGLCWGCVGLYRHRQYADFNAGEADFVAELTPHLARGFRAAAVSRRVAPETIAEDPGLIILDERGGVEAVTLSAQRWLEEVVDLPVTQARPLPHPVYAVAGRAAASGERARLRLRTRAGRWLALHASRLEGRRSSGLIGVVIEPAPTVELAPLIVAAYGLTERERVVAELVVRGRPTKEIAIQLRVSGYTVNDHLRAVFDKVGVKSRGELVARIFFDHYLPALAVGASPGSVSASAAVP